MALLVGLGNPGKKFVGTRHNLGFEVIQRFAKMCGLELKENALLKGFFAQGTYQGKPFAALMPTTYMNESGVAVGACVARLKGHPNDVLVVCDDAALPLGTLRLRLQGSPGGHNGLKSIEEHLRTQSYPRLRMGIGAPQEGEKLEDFVLSRFTEEELKIVSDMKEEANKILEVWLLEGLAAASSQANQKKEK
jgi:PTH1 family peptidyl-tRNA hydrolase